MRLASSEGTSLLTVLQDDRVAAASSEKQGRFLGRWEAEQTVFASVNTRQHRTRDGSCDELTARHFLGRGGDIEFAMEADWIGRKLPEGVKSVLDVGCGIGALFDTIGEARVIGLDHNRTGLRHTRLRFPRIPLLAGDAQSPPVGDRSIGAITAQHVIEHLPSCKPALAAWFNILQPGGILLIVTPNPLFRDPSVFADDTHVHLFKPGELGSLVCNAGFEVIEVCTLGLPWFRDYGKPPGGWRLRQWVIHNAGKLSAIPWLRWQGQTLCCAARRPES